MFRHTLAAIAIVATATACGSGIKEIEVVPAPSALRVVADSTATLVSIAAHVTDSAMVKARVATVSRDANDTRSLVAGARHAVATAGSYVTSAMKQGDWLRNVVAEEDRGDEYVRYWSMGRVKLDEARALSQIAVAVADSALACTEASCASEAARRMQEHVQAAAGAAREAESVVRVAMVHVK